MLSTCRYLVTPKYLPGWCIEFAPFQDLGDILVLQRCNGYNGVHNQRVFIEGFWP
jgi:hypothetical protein